jgi:putative ABC transport system permease protein
MSKEGPGQLNNGAFGVIPLGTAQRIFSRAGELDQIDIVATPQSASSTGLDSLKTSLQERLGEKYTVVYPAAQGKRVTQMLDGYQMGLNMFSAIALFVGAFLIYNTFSMTVVERTREIGTLRTLGMTRSQVMGQILTEAGFLGITGAICGVGVGILLSQGLIRVMELVLAQQVKQIHVPPTGLVTSVLVGLCVTVGAATVPAWQASRVSPLEAVRIRGNPRENWLIRRGWILGVVFLITSYLLLYHIHLSPALEELFSNLAVFGLLLGGTLLVPATVDAWERIARPWVRRIYGSEGQLGSRNTQRAKLRTTLTVAALMIGVAMILSIRAVTSAFGDDIETWMEKYIGGDMYVHSSLPMQSDLAQRLEAVDGVEVVTPIRYFEVKRIKPDGGSERLSFMAVDPASYRHVTSFVFTAGQGDPNLLLDRLAAGDTVFISSVISEKYGLRQGDTIRLETRRGRQDFEIAGVVVDFFNQGLVIQGSWTDMRRYFDQDDVSAFLLKVQPNHSVEDVRDRIDQLYGKRRHLAVELNKALKDRALGLIAQTSGMFDVLAVIAMIVAALGVVNTMTMNVLERTQEIGMLRSLGMTRRQVAKMILAEAGMIGLIGGVFGLVFGLFQSRVVLTSINSMAGYELTYILPTQGILVGLIISLIVSQLAAIWPAWRAAGIRIIEAIQFE